MIRKPYESREEFPGEFFEEPTRTQQHFAQECNINEILRKYSITGVLPVNSQEAWYADISDIPASYQEALEISKRAQEHFLTLPAKVRAFFENNCSLYVDFVTNPSEADIATGIELGLWTAPDPAPANETPAEKQVEPTNSAD